jgi:predicted alpha/beta hydrolase
MDESAALDAYLFRRDERDDDIPDPGVDLELAALDGAPLAATLFVGGGGLRRRTVVIASATGVRRRYYAPFAGWLAERGYDVVTFDYRGIGSSPGRRRATMHDWGELDLAGVVSWARARSQRLGVVGHSVGGQLIGLLPRPSDLDAVVSIAGQSGDYRLWPMPLRLAMAALWYGVVPGVTHAVGYLPGALGVGEDLPAGVALEWARWCRTSDYLWGAEPDRVRYAEVRAPVLALSFAGDTYAPEAAVDALARLFVNADVDRRHLAQPRIGHFGFFRAHRRALWTDAGAFLDAALTEA